jgi:phytanoyl-CoA hydroxylase
MAPAPHFPELDPAAVERFRRDGFLAVERVLDGEQVAALRRSFPRLFAGDFDTGVYPDEWYWREGMSLPDATRHMGNAWKSDLTVARLVLAEEVAAAAAKLAGWSGVRLAQDTIWWKAPKTKPIAYHQDSSFMNFLDPPVTLTCWVTLDDTRAGAGTLEYAPGSHRWPLTPLPKSFHGPDDYRAQMIAAGEAAGVAVPEPYFIEVPAGSCVFHAGEIWHGSGPNPSGEIMRRSIGIHLVPAEARFSERPGGYIHRRYQRTGVAEMDESFFPILWSEDGYRTGWIAHYCATGERRNG